MVRENIHDHGSGGSVVSIPDVRLVILTTVGQEPKRGVLDPDCFPTITTSRTFVPGREYDIIGNSLWLLWKVCESYTPLQPHRFR